MIAAASTRARPGSHSRGPEQGVFLEADRRLQRLAVYPDLVVVEPQAAGGEPADDLWIEPVLHRLDTGVEPALVAITSFNEWHEGTQIEPAAAGAENGRGYTYDDYGSLGPEGYLDLTRQWVDKFTAMEWPEGGGTRARVRIQTSSDWTTLALLEGGSWLQPGLSHPTLRFNSGWMSVV